MRAVPEELTPVLAEIEAITDLGRVIYYEVVYHNGESWHSFAGSKTFEDGETALKWRYAAECFGEGNQSKGKKNIIRRITR